MTNNDNRNVNGSTGNHAPRFDKLKGKLASKAATAVGGPAAGKAVDTLNKIKNNVNNTGYANNTRNRFGHANSTSIDNQSDLDNNIGSNGGTNSQQNDNSNPLKKIGSMLGGNNKVNSNDSVSTKFVKTIRKMRKIISTIAALSPFIMSFLGVIIIVVIIMIQFAAVENYSAQIKVGIEKLINFTAGEGWTTNEDAFFKRLQEENLTYKRFSNDSEDLDLPLIASTIHYDRIVDINKYEQNSAGNENFDGDNNAMVKSNQTSSFFGVAGDMLGKVNSLIPGNKKLLGHLVKVDVEWVEANELDDAIIGWKNFFGQYGDQIKEITGDTVGDTCANYPSPVFCLISYYQQLIAMEKALINYSNQYDDILAYPNFSIANIEYEASENLETFKDIFNDSRQVNEGNISSWYKYPQITYTMDYENYKKYLKNVFIPFTIYKGVEITDKINIDIDNIIEEIFAQRDYYNYLFHSEIEDSGNLCTSNLSNIKVKLYSCGNGNTGVEKYYVETVNFDDYVKGVVIAEEGGVVTNQANKEFVKAFILAAKSYTLGRGVRYMKPSYFDLDSPVLEVELQNCSNDQNYKNYNKATPSQRKVIDELYEEVNNQILVTNPESTRVKTAGYMNNAPHACGSHDCSKGNGNLINVTEAAKLSRQGYTYDKILTYYYGDNYSIKNISTQCKCNNYAETVVGDWANWKQAGSSWSGIVIGHKYNKKTGKKEDRTVGRIGCFITSYSIQMARSGLFGSDFDPGVFAKETLKTNCYSSGGGFNGGACFRKAFSNAPTVKHKEYSGNSLKEIASQMKNDIVNNNCYLTLRVKYEPIGQHWVAVAGIDDNNNILIVDPASSNDKGIHILDNKYCLEKNYNIHKMKSVKAQCLLFDGVSGENVTSNKIQSLDNTKSAISWENWRQFDKMWGSVEIVKGHPELSLTKKGCLLTSYAIQMARSKTVSQDFNPGNFTTTLRDNGAFGGSKGVIDPDVLKSKYPQVTDSYSKTYTYNGLNELAEKIKYDMNNGCYVTLQSKYNSDHFIAVVDVDSKNNIIIVDPASGKSGKTTLNNDYCNSRKQDVCNRTSVDAYCLKISSDNNSSSNCSFKNEKSNGATCIGKFCFPLPYPTYNNEGYYCNMEFSNGGHHEGSDYYAPEGKNIYAYKAGTVKYVRYDDGDEDGRGTYIVLEHDCSDGTACYTLYGHMVLNSNSHLKVGDTVEEGSIIGKVGQTGNATGSHLHVEFWTKYEPHKAYYDPVQEMVNVGFIINESKNKTKKVNNVKNAVIYNNEIVSNIFKKESGASCNGKFCFPLPYPKYNVQGWYYGRNGHDGSDFAAPKGTNIYAYKDGTVYDIKYNRNVQIGTYVILKHDDCGDGTACYTRYGHMSMGSNDFLKKGDKVEAGAVIGKVGGTGVANGYNHLHFDMWRTNKSNSHYDPARELVDVAGFTIKNDVTKPNSTSPSPITTNDKKSKNTSSGAKCIGNYCFPVKYGTKITSPYGQRTFTLNGKRISNYHKGIDLGAGSGQNIYSYKPGKVLTVAYNPGGYGNYVILQHDCSKDNVCYTLYAHMIRRSKLKVGDNVKAGDIIGYVGSTGRSTGPHLHFEVRDGKENRNNPVPELEKIGFKFNYR